MQHLRLVGVHEDGSHLLLADDEGNRYAVPLDEPLRAAARRDRPRLGQLQIESSGGLRPKDVQAMIRAGLTAEEVAERAGWPVEKVHRYEGPILAEREHVAGLARQVRLRSRGATGGTAQTLDARVSERLRTRAIDAGSARWDSRRTDKGAWTVLLLFAAGGREREAAWHFDPLARTVSATDDEARWLSEDEDQQAPGPIPAPHLSAPSRPSRVYDVEAEGGVSAAAPVRRREGETVDLMAAMRERSAQRGRRRRPKSADVPGLETAPEEALPLEELARDPREELPPAAHTHPEDDPEVVKTGAAEDRIGVEAAQRQARRTEATQPVRQTLPPEPTVTEPAVTQPAEAVAEPAEALAEPAEPIAETSPPVEEPAEDDVTDVAPEGAAPEAESAGDEDDDATDDAPAVDAHVDDRPDILPDLLADAAPHEERSPAGSDAARATEPEHDDVIERRTPAAAAAPAAPAPPAAAAAASSKDRPRPGIPKPKPAARKSGRPGVPSWDDIMFGRKSD